MRGLGQQPVQLFRLTIRTASGSRAAGRASHPWSMRDAARHPRPNHTSHTQGVFEPRRRIGRPGFSCRTLARRGGSAEDNPRRRSRGPVRRIMGSSCRLTGAQDQRGSGQRRGDKRWPATDRSSRSASRRNTCWSIPETRVAGQHPAAGVHGALQGAAGRPGDARVPAEPGRDRHRRLRHDRRGAGGAHRAAPGRRRDGARVRDADDRRPRPTPGRTGASRCRWTWTATASSAPSTRAWRGGWRSAACTSMPGSRTRTCAST